jgi:tight adherence protein C
MTPNITMAVIAGVGIYGGGMAVAFREATKAEIIRQRLLSLRSAEAETDSKAWVTTALRPVAWIGGLVARSGLLSQRSLEEVRHALRISGFTGASGLALFVGLKVILFTGLPLLVLLLPPSLGIFLPFPIAFAGLFGIIGLLAPDYVIRRRRTTYLRSVEVGLADALDMMVICADAGLALEASLERVGTEIALAHPTVSRELMLTVREMQVNADRRAVLLALGARTGLPSLQRVTAALAQAMSFGTPLSSALRALSAEMRQEQLTRYEERAARLPVLLTVPMIVFILPAVFLIVAGPAMLNVLKSLGM